MHKRTSLTSPNSVFHGVNYVSKSPEDNWQVSDLVNNNNGEIEALADSNVNLVVCKTPFPRNFRTKMLNI